MNTNEMQTRLSALGLNDETEYSLAEIENTFLQNKDLYLCTDIQKNFHLEIYHAEEAKENDVCETILMVGDSETCDQLIFNSHDYCDKYGNMFTGYTYRTIVNAFQLDKSQRIWFVRVDNKIEG